MCLTNVFGCSIVLWPLKNHRPTNKFCFKEQPANEVFEDRPALFDMFNILVGPTDETEKQMMSSLPDWRRFIFISDQKSMDFCDQTTFVVPYFLQHSSSLGMGPSGENKTLPPYESVIQ